VERIIFWVLMVKSGIFIIYIHRENMIYHDRIFFQCEFGIVTLLTIKIPWVITCCINISYTKYFVHEM